MNEFRIYKATGKSGKTYYKFKFFVNDKEIKQEIFIQSADLIAQVCELLGASVINLDDVEEE